MTSVAIGSPEQCFPLMRRYRGPALTHCATITVNGDTGEVTVEP